MGNRLIYVVAFVLAALLVRHLLKPKEPTPDDMRGMVLTAFNNAADELNRQGPHMADAATRLDSAEVGPGVRMTYHYTLLGHSSDLLAQPQVLDKLKAQMIGKVCGQPGMAKAMRYGGIYVYDYKGSDGGEVANIEINKDVCGPALAPAQ